MTAVQKTHNDRYEAQRLAQERNLFGRLQTAALAARVQAQRLLKSAGQLSVNEWRILWDLAEAGPLTVTQMTNIQRIDHALISRAISTLVAKGYVTTTTEKGDRRKSRVTLTDAGRAAFDETSVTMSERRVALANAFSEDELDTFLKLIHRFEHFAQAPLPPTTVDKHKS